MRIRRNVLKRLYFRLLQLTQADRRLLRSICQSRRMVVLSLHRVSPQGNPFWNPLHPLLFEELLVFIKRHFRVTSLGVPHEDAPRPPLVLSFDDGYRDFVEYAMPILQRHGIRANQNIIPACVETGQPPWTMQLYDFLQAAPRSLVNEIRLDGFSQRLRSDQDEHKVQYGLALSRFLKHRSRHERQALWPPIAAVMAKANGTVRQTPMMRLEDVRTAATVHDIGAHAYAHDSMGLESDAFFTDDLARCQEFFRRQLARPLTIYAFPNGSYRPEQISMLQEQGVRHILLIDEQLASPEARILPRLTIYGDSSLELQFHVLGYRARRSECVSRS